MGTLFCGLCLLVIFTTAVSDSKVQVHRFLLPYDNEEVSTSQWISDDADLTEGSGRFRSLNYRETRKNHENSVLGRSFHPDFPLVVPQWRQQPSDVCIVNLTKALVVFVVDVGEDMPEVALPKVKDFIMSTLLVMELAKDKVRVGIVSMGSIVVGANRVLTLSEGSNHRAVQKGLDRLVKGDSTFDLATALAEVNTILGSASNVTVVVIPVLTAPYKETEVVADVMGEMASRFEDISFYVVTLSTISIRVGNLSQASRQNTSTPAVILVSEYGHPAYTRASRVAIRLREKYGCNYCKPNPCEFGAVCFLTENWYECACPEGYVSGICEPCLRNPCNGSRCLPTGTSYVCDPCDPSPCQNGGKCYYGIDANTNNAVCECPANFLGTFCELRCPDCPTGSTCRNIDEQAVCECLEGLVGADCSRNCEASITCLNGGTCDFDESRTPICRCVDDFYGPVCEHLCEATTCLNGGSCGVSNGERLCYCTAQFEGELCEVDKCDYYFSCKNKGVCGVDSTTSQIQCKCVPPFTGVDCGIGPCSNYSCFHNGVCKLNENSQPVCDCIAPYFGHRCLDDPCSENPCLNDGICLLENLSYSCTCTPGFWGPLCSFNPCIPNPCNNSGTCLPLPLNRTDSNRGYTFKCSCTELYTGDRCDESITTPFPLDIATAVADSGVCIPNPCEEPCECKPSCKHSDGFVCVSRNGRLGKTCSIDAPDLDCGSDAVTITIDDLFLIEMLGNNARHGYFVLGWNVNNTKSASCKSDVAISEGHAVHKLIVPAPFTACGTETSMNDDKVLTISNKIWFNINSSVVDMLSPILTWFCNYTTQYTATTSLLPVVDENAGSLTITTKRYYSVNFQLCKLTTRCNSQCPNNLIVNPGAVYTVGQHINVIIKPVVVAGEILKVVDFYLSCGHDPNSTAVIPIVDGGCYTGVLHSTLLTEFGSTCITFQLPQLIVCKNVVYLHAKLGFCERTEACGHSNGIRCVSSGRKRRSINSEDVYGPIYIFPLNKHVYVPELRSQSSDLTSAQTNLKNVPDVPFEAEDTNFILVFLLAAVSFVLLCCLVFMCYFHNARYLNLHSKSKHTHVV